MNPSCVTRRNFKVETLKVATLYSHFLSCFEVTRTWLGAIETVSFCSIGCVPSTPPDRAGAVTDPPLKRKQRVFVVPLTALDDVYVLGVECILTHFLKILYLMTKWLYIWGIHPGTMKSCYLTTASVNARCVMAHAGWWVLVSDTSQQIGLKILEETVEMLHLENSFVWC